MSLFRRALECRDNAVGCVSSSTLVWEKKDKKKKEVDTTENKFFLLGF